MRRLIPTLVVVMSCVTSCAEEESTVAPVADSCADQLAERYRFLSEFPSHPLSEDEVRARLPYERIELEYFSYWEWGGDRITLERNGTSRMADRAGHRECKLSAWDFARLCWLVEREGLESLDPNYETKGLFDATTITVRAWRSGEETPIEVVDYGYEAPIALKAIHAAINGVARTADWKPAAAPAAASSPR